MLSGFRFSRIKSRMMALLILSYIILPYSIYIFHFRGLDLSVMNEERIRTLRLILSTEAGYKT